MSTNESTREIAVSTSTAEGDLARATVAIDEPADLYPLIGELLSSLHSLVQTTDQLAHAHMRYRGRARTQDGDIAAGGREVDDATWALVRARELLAAAGGSFDLAAHACGQVAWSSADRVHRWVSVVHLQGPDAEPVLDMLDRSGTPATIRHLAGWDRGDETTEAALIDGYVYEGIPTCHTDHVAEDPTSGYTLVHNRALGYVSLLRNFPTTVDDGDLEHSSIDVPVPASRTPAAPAWTPRHGHAPRTALRSVAL